MVRIDRYPRLRERQFGSAWRCAGRATPPPDKLLGTWNECDGAIAIVQGGISAYFNLDVGSLRAMIKTAQIATHESTKAYGDFFALHS